MRIRVPVPVSPVVSCTGCSTPPLAKSFAPLFDAHLRAVQTAAMISPSSCLALSDPPPRIAQQLLEHALKQHNGLDLLVDAVTLCQALVADLDVHVVRRLGSAEERLRAELNLEISSALADCDPRYLAADEKYTWPRLRRAMLRCSRFGMVNLPAYKEAAERASLLQRSFHSSTDRCLLEHFQFVFDHMHSPAGTSPRLVVERVIERQALQAYNKYLLRRTALANDCRGNSDMSQVLVKSSDIFWGPPLGFVHEPVNRCYNEFFLFYATSTDKVSECSAVATLDLNTDGSHGVCLAEDPAHAQRLAARMGRRRSKDAEETFAIAVCRAFCGSIRNAGRADACCSASPAPAALREPWWGPPSEQDSRYHSTMRTASERASTSREFTLPADQVLPEYIVLCHHER